MDRLFGFVYDADVAYIKQEVIVLFRSVIYNMTPVSSVIINETSTLFNFSTGKYTIYC